MATTAKFVEQYGLYSAEQQAAAQQSLEAIKQHGIEIVRLVWPDQHGLLRGKALTVKLQGPVEAWIKGE